MDLNYVIKKPLITEKATWGMQEQARYAFEVDRRATKPEIKAAVEQQYKVKVEKVNTLVRKGETRRLRYGVVIMPSTKRAVVRLKEGQTIELF